MNKRDPGRPLDLPRAALGLAGELRAPFEAARFWLARLRVDALPRGDGHPVVLLPGFAMGEEAMRPLGTVLAALGHDVRGWGEGRNWGLRAPTLGRLVAAIGDLASRHGRRVSLVGWSAGGLYAREIARHIPDAVRCVVTFGTPVHGDAHGRPEVALFRGLLNALSAARGAAVIEPDPTPPRVPLTAIHSRTDAVVAWQASIEHGPDAENITVDGSHLGLGMNADVLAIVAARLARPDRIA